MNEYILHTSDLNSSLVFYRALFDRMPKFMDAFRLEFELDELSVKIKESRLNLTKKDGPFHFNMEKAKLKEVYRKMRRFTKLNRLKEDCEQPTDAIGLIDPDGHKWIIGSYRSDISFEKCYTNF